MEISFLKWLCVASGICWEHPEKVSMEAPYGDIKSEWIKYLNVKPKTIYLQENMGKLCDIRLGNDL